MHCVTCVMIKLLKILIVFIIILLIVYAQVLNYIFLNIKKIISSFGGVRSSIFLKKML